MKHVEKLRVGMPVVIEDKGREKRILSEVERVTDTQIVIKGFTTKFRRKDGTEVGGTSWSALCIIDATPAEMQRMRAAERRSAMLATIRNVDFKKLDNATLEQVIEVLKANKK